MSHIRRKLAGCMLGCAFTMGCSHSLPKDANATCGQQPNAPRNGMHGHIMTSVGNGLGHMAPMALSAIPGMNGIGGGIAGMGMQQAMNRVGMDHTHGMGNNDPLHPEGEDSEAPAIPSFPCEPEKSVPSTINNQDIKFDEGK